MRVRLILLALAVTGLITQPSFADSNATINSGALLNSETVSLGAGPFDHGAGSWNSVDNSFTTATFTGGFTANRIRFTGTATSVLATTWAFEARMVITPPGGGDSFTYLGPVFYGVRYG